VVTINSLFIFNGVSSGSAQIGASVDVAGIFVNVLDEMPGGTLRRKQALVCAVLIGLIGIPVCLLLIPERQAPMPPLPNPNGYDEIRAALAGMTPLTSFDPSIRGGSDDTLHAALHVDVENNVEALRLARSGLNKECRVPVQDTPTYGTNHVAELARIKALTLTFIAEGQLAEREGRLAGAARGYTDAIRLGQAISQGGLLIDVLVGIACEAMGINSVKKLVPRLDAQTCKELVGVLEKLESFCGPVEAVLQQARTYGNRYRTAEAKGLQQDRIIARGEPPSGDQNWTWERLVPSFIIHNRQIKTAQERTRLKMQRKEVGLRLILLTLAIRALELEKGTSPTSLAELAPAYLKAVPVDPYSGKPFLYRAQPGGLKPYSVGPDGKDDGGVSIQNWNTDRPAGDVSYDSPF
jgi:hypothetical protein